jgi:hypothetical protein
MPRHSHRITHAGITGRRRKARAATKSGTPDSYAIKVSSTRAVSYQLGRIRIQGGDIYVKRLTAQWRAAGTAVSNGIAQPGRVRRKAGSLLVVAIQRGCRKRVLVQHLTKFGVTICTAAMITATLGTAPAVPAEANGIAITPDSGTAWPQQKIAVTGSGCPAGTSRVWIGLRLRVGGSNDPRGEHSSAILDSIVNPDGSFSGTIIPAADTEPGPHLVYVVCMGPFQQVLRLAGPFFEVLPSTVLPPGHNAAVRITRVSPAGLEWIKLRNSTTAAVQLRGFTLKDRSGRTLTLPRYWLRPDATVRVYTGAGAPSAGRIYLGRRTDVWSAHDAALLYDSRGVLVDKLRY